MSFRNSLMEGRQVVGTWLFAPNTIFMELAAQVGIDFVLIDLEHGEASLQDIPMLLRAARGSTMAVLVRPPSHDLKTLSKLADFGVDGVVVPKVDTAEEARDIASACRYPPRGTRGMAIGSIRASGYGTEAGYRATADDQMMVAVQIETRAGLENSKSIQQVSEVDMIFIGPNDLTAELGYEAQCQQSTAEIDALVDQLKSSSKLLGTIPYFGVGRQALLDRGISLLVIGSDIAAQRQFLQNLKSPE
ncbi:MAG: aldolase/citrate lyase family protein [Stappiaceae bacterium]